MSLMIGTCRGVPWWSRSPSDFPVGRSTAVGERIRHHPIAHAIPGVSTTECARCLELPDALQRCSIGGSIKRRHSTNPHPGPITIPIVPALESFWAIDLSQFRTAWVNCANLEGFRVASASRNRGSARASPVKSACISSRTLRVARSAPTASRRCPYRASASVRR